MHNQFKAQATAIIIAIIALIIVAGSGYLILQKRIIKNNNSIPLTTSKTTVIPTSDTISFLYFSLKEETSDYISGDIEFKKLLVVNKTSNVTNKDSDVFTVVTPDLSVIDIQTNKNTKYSCAVEAEPGYGCGKVNRYCYIEVQATIKQFKKLREDIPIFGIIEAKEIKLLDCNPFKKTISN